MQNQLKDKRHRFQICLEKMKVLSPLLKLNQGFSYVQQENQKALKSISQVKEGDKIQVYVTDGIVKATVNKTEEVQHG